MGIAQASSGGIAPLLFLKFHSDYGIPLGQIALISTVFFLTQLIMDVMCAKFVCLRIDGDESAVGAIGNGYFGGFARVVEFGDANEPSLSRFERFFERFFFSLSWRRLATLVWEAR